MQGDRLRVDGAHASAVAGHPEMHARVVGAVEQAARKAAGVCIARACE